MNSYSVVLEKDGVSMPFVRKGIGKEAAKEFIDTMRPGQRVTVWCMEGDDDDHSASGVE